MRPRINTAKCKYFNNKRNLEVCLYIVVLYLSNVYFFADLLLLQCCWNQCNVYIFKIITVYNSDSPHLRFYFCVLPRHQTSVRVDCAKNCTRHFCKAFAVISGIPSISVKHKINWARTRDLRNVFSPLSDCYSLI